MDLALQRFPDTGFAGYTPNPNTSHTINLVTGDMKVIYINNKTGKEISEKKAKKKDKQDVNIFLSDGTQRIPVEAGPDGAISKGPHSLADIDRIYYPNGR